MTIINNKKPIFVIAAKSINGVIGNKGKIPWHLKDDMLRFKRITINNPIIMGRKTYETFSRPLPDRTHIVISRKPQRLRSDSVIPTTSIDEAIQIAQSLDQGENIFVIGGGEIYKQFFDKNLVDGILLTGVNISVDGDAFFPDVEYDLDKWRRVSVHHKLSDEFNDYNSKFEVYLNTRFRDNSILRNINLNKK